MESVRPRRFASSCPRPRTRESRANGWPQCACERGANRGRPRSTIRRRARENERTAARRISATVGQPRPVSATGVPWVRATHAVRGPAKTPRCRHFFWRHRPHLFCPWDVRIPMGHHELGRLSGSRKWRQVIALISGGADGARRSTGGSFMALCMATHLKKALRNPPCAAGPRVLQLQGGRELRRVAVARSR